MSAEPRFATRRNKRRKSLAPDVERVAGLLGFELMPWQRAVLGPAMEWRSDGRPFHKTVTVTVPRQQGKSVLVAAVAAHRCLTFPSQHVMFLAQTRIAASARLQDVALKLKRAGVPNVDFFRGIGQERIVFDVHGDGQQSTIRVESPSAKGGHGESLDLVVLDEAWSLEDHTLQGILPTMTAKRNAQLWTISTMGTEDSEVWNRYVEAGRLSVTDPNSVVAYTEYAADLAGGDDVNDPSTWHRFMPALGITVEAENILPSLDAMSPGERMRAYGNVLTATDSELFPADWLERGLDAYQVTPDSGVVLAFDTNWDPRASSIAAAWETERGWHSEVVARDAGMRMEDLFAELERLVKKVRPVAVCSVGGTSAREIQGQIKALCDQHMITYRVLPNQDYAAACQGFYEGLRTGTVTFGDNESLDNALRRVVVKDTGELWRFDSKASRVDVSPLVACADALFVAREVAARRMQVAIY